MLQVMRHLINHLGHFPMTGDTTLCYTNLQENSHLDSGAEELTREIFESPNLQMFVCNKSTLITIMEMEKV